MADAPRTLLDVLAGIETQLTRIADSSIEATPVVSVERVLEAWDEAGMRADEDLAVDFATKLGMQVEG